MATKYRTVNAITKLHKQELKERAAKLAKVESLCLAHKDADQAALDRAHDQQLAYAVERDRLKVKHKEQLEFLRL